MILRLIDWLIDWSLTYFTRFKFVVLPIGDKPFFELPGPADAPSTIDPQAEPSDFAKTEEPNPNAESDNKPTGIVYLTLSAILV